MKKKLVAGLILALSAVTVCPAAAFASTDHYTDSSVVGKDNGWDEWSSSWETTE